jgi:cytochrome P450
MSKVPVVKELGVPLFLKFLKDPLAQLAHIQQAYGDLSMKRVLGVSYYFLFHPDHAEHLLSTHQDNHQKHPMFVSNFEPFLGSDNLLSTNNPPQWRRDRELCKTAFEADVYFEKYAERVVQNCRASMEDWQKRFVPGTVPFLVGAELDWMTLKTINETIFHELDVDAGDLARRVPRIFELIAKKATSLTRLPWIFPSKVKRSYQGEARYLQQVKNKALLTRLEQGKDLDDLLGTLLASYEVRDAASPDFGMVANHMMTFDVVGYTGTTSALRWIVTALVQHPEEEARIASEVRSVCNGADLTYGGFQKLVHTQAFVLEVLRLYPPLGILLRKSIAEDSLGDYPLPAGASLMLSIHHIHRHRDYWADPETFKPERFVAKPYGQDCQFAYLPFGAGPRSCVGRNFAVMNLTLVTAMMVQRFQFQLPRDFQLRRQYIASAFVRPNLESVTIREKAG